MWLDLSKIIEMPGARTEFQVTLDPEHFSDPAILRFKYPPEARGEVVNTAGLLNLRGELQAEMTCVCDRCGTAFDRKKVLSLDVPLAADVEVEVSPEVFEVEGDGLTARAFCHEIDHLEGKLFVDVADHIMSEEELNSYYAEGDGED